MPGDVAVSPRREVSQHALGSLGLVLVRAPQPVRLVGPVGAQLGIGQRALANLGETVNTASQGAIPGRTACTGRYMVAT